MGLQDQKRFTDLCEAGAGAQSLEHLYDAFRDFLRSPGMAEVLNEALRPLTANHAQELIGWEATRLVLWASRHYALHLQYHVVPSDALYGITSDGLVGVVGPGALRVRRYRIPPGYDNEVFDPGCALEFDREETFAPGEVLCCRKDREAIDFVLDEPITLLKLFSKRTSSLLWSFDKTTLRTTNVYSSELEPSILTYMAQLAGAMADKASVPALRHLCSHELHFVRWDAMSQLCSLDPDAALETLTKALEDPHPHVRNAARRSLAGMQQSNSIVETTGKSHGDYARV